MAGLPLLHNGRVLAYDFLCVYSYDIAPMPIGVPEGSQPLLIFRARARLLDGSLEPIALDHRPQRFVVKASNRVADNDVSAASVVGVIIGPPGNGDFSVQLPASVTQTAGVYFYAARLLGNTGNPVCTVAFGDFVVHST